MNTLELSEVIAGFSRITSGLVIAYLVYRLARRVPWPSPFRLRFALLHVVAAPIAALMWMGLSNAMESLVPGWTSDLVGSTRIYEFLFIGIIFYAITLGISHSVEGSARAVRAEAAAARTQLAALRSQIQPHFLFNALHTVVQLIPIDPARAIAAAELVADLLRVTMEDDRDVVTLRAEWSFVSRYLEMERIRFGDRLQVHADMDPDLLDARVPSFALQTLVENAVRHGAAPRVAPTDIVITANGTKSELMLSVRNAHDSALSNGHNQTAGTGLNRLRERLVALYGNTARLTCGVRADGQYEAVVVVPRTRDS